jgi:hypothetical protein
LLNAGTEARQESQRPENTRASAGHENSIDFCFHSILYYSLKICQKHFGAFNDFFFVDYLLVKFFHIMIHLIEYINEDK